jgi:hypothetical protein
MQHRWERVLNRAETEGTLAAEKMRSQRAATRGADDRNVNVPSGFEQPAYTSPTGETRPADTQQQPAQPAEPAEPSQDPRNR